MIYFNFVRELMLWERALRKDFKQSISKEVSFKEAVYMWFVMTTSGSPYELGRFLGKDPGQLYRELRKLEEKGLVERILEEENTSYTLSDKGRGIIGKVGDSIQEYEDEHIETMKKAAETLTHLRGLREAFLEDIETKKK